MVSDEQFTALVLEVKALNLAMAAIFVRFPDARELLREMGENAHAQSLASGMSDAEVDGWKAKVDALCRVPTK